jgi:hypothetical protein
MSIAKTEAALEATRKKIAEQLSMVGRSIQSIDPTLYDKEQELERLLKHLQAVSDAPTQSQKVLLVNEFENKREHWNACKHADIEGGLIKATYYGNTPETCRQIISSYLHYSQFGKLIEEHPNGYQALEPFEGWWNEYISDGEDEFVEPDTSNCKKCRVAIKNGGDWGYCTCCYEETRAQEEQDDER